MEFIIKNCNNIDAGKIKITQSKLNLKFGINGTGKSTLAKAIKYGIESPEKLSELTPFKLRNTQTELMPEVIKPEGINSVFIFNEEYLNQFLYKEDELISNSFEIFIKTPNYIQSIERIDEILTGIKTVFSENQELEQIIKDFESLSNSFKTTQTGLSKTSAIFKALEEGGNKIEHIPEHLKGYSSFLKDKSCITWLEWQIKGEQFIDISDDCPYCTSPTIEKKETIKSVSKTYDKNVIKNFNIIIDAIQNLGDYFSDDAKVALEFITNKQSGLDDSEINYIVTIKHQIDNLLSKLKALKEISPKSFKDDEKADEKIKRLIILFEVFDRFKSKKSIEVINSLNESLTTVLNQIGQLQGEINKQKAQTKQIIEQHQESINAFLKNAGYNYLVEITDKIDDYKLILRHIESKEKISRGNQHLSFGEKNAFALVLFMHEALSKNPDIIILDDPISSFDKNKKYAIMDMLFNGEKNLKNKTVLMLTHDLEPIIDTIKILNRNFGSFSEAKFLTTKGSLLTEKEIKKDSLMTFSQICEKTIDSEIEDIIKLIYLRRYYEIINDLGNEYQVLSNLFHKRKIIEIKDLRKETSNYVMTEEDFNDGSNEIKRKITNFDYSSLLLKISENEQIKNIYQSSNNSYVKLHLFRILYEDSLGKIGSVLRKFINESYHIENELICQLDPTEFDLIPDFVIDECDKYVLENTSHTIS